MYTHTHIIAGGLPGFQALKDNACFKIIQFAGHYFAQVLKNRIFFLYMRVQCTRHIIRVYNITIFSHRYVIKEEITGDDYYFKDKIGAITPTVNAKVDSFTQCNTLITSKN